MIQDDIREHLATYKPTAVFRYGRNFDASLDSAKTLITEWFIHLDPLTFDGVINDTRNSRVVMGFLKQDAPDSNFDKDDNLDINPSIEEIQNDALVLAEAWLNDFLDNYNYSPSTYTVTPLTRIKNVMSGVLLSVTLNGKPTC